MTALPAAPARVAHVTTVNMSLYYLLLNQLRAIREAGYGVAGISSPGPFVQEIRAADVEFIPLPMTRTAFSPLADLRALYRLYRVMRRQRFEIVHTHNPKPGLLGQLAARWAGVPVVANTIHGYYFHERQHAIVRFVLVTLERLAARMSDVIFFQNEEDLAIARRERIGSADRLRFLGNGIDLRRFDRSAVSAQRVAALRTALGLGVAAPVVGFVGRLVKEKGILDFLAALRAVREAVPGTRALIVGPVDTDKPDAVTPEAAVLAGIAEGCVFTGARDEMPELYAVMNVFVLPSHREGLPRTPMEASAMSVPCVVTDVRGCRQVVDHDRNGLRVPVGDVPALARAIIAILTDPAAAARMGAEGRRMALERFDEQIVFDRILAEYARLLRAKGMPVPAPTRRPIQRAIKRTADVIIASIALVALSPLLLAVAVAVRVAMGSPVLFRQSRLGYRGRTFIIYKFRTMRDARDGAEAPRPDAERLTPLGRFLRATTLDELPELVNVVRGEMSLVGPRPLLVEYRDLYTPEQWRRHDVPPGMAGPVLVGGRNILSWEEKFRLDIWYVDHWSLWVDVVMLVRTFLRVLRREGISQPGHATMPKFDGARRP